VLICFFFSPPFYFSFPSSWLCFSVFTLSLSHYIYIIVGLPSTCIALNYFFCNLILYPALTVWSVVLNRFLFQKAGHLQSPWGFSESFKAEERLPSML
jgi:hypothetical protein